MPSNGSIPRSPSASPDGLRRLQREPADEDAEASEQSLLFGRQQVVAPGDRIAQRLLAGRQVPRAARQQREPALQAAQQRLGA